jgi:hypothetical protein
VKRGSERSQAGRAIRAATRAPAGMSQQYTVCRAATMTAAAWFHHSHPPPSTPHPQPSQAKPSPASHHYAAVMQRHWGGVPAGAGHLLHCRQAAGVMIIPPAAGFNASRAVVCVESPCGAATGMSRRQRAAAGHRLHRNQPSPTPPGAVAHNLMCPNLNHCSWSACPPKISTSLSAVMVWPAGRAAQGGAGQGGAAGLERLRWLCQTNALFPALQPCAEPVV